jgi:23S rRNA G2445 N2-methylase RlmL
MHLFITCPPNLEDALAEELQELGIPARRWPRGVSAPLSMENVYIINYGSHLATRVLWPLAHFDCDGRDTLYDEAKKIPWTDYLSVDQTFAIDTNVTAHPEFKNSHFAGLVVKDAICDVFREKTGSPTFNSHFLFIKIRLLSASTPQGLPSSNGTIALERSKPLFKRR